MGIVLALSATGGSGMKLLIIDDEADLVEALNQYLSQSGHICATALKYHEAIDQIAQDHPELVLTDYRLPDGDGLGIIKTVRQKSQRTPVILMTAYDNPSLKQMALKAGARLPKQTVRSQNLSRHDSPVVTMSNLATRLSPWDAADTV